MMAILHHNSTIDSEARGEKINTRKSLRVSRTNNEPNLRIYKTVILDWQKELLEYVKCYKKDSKLIINAELVEEFDELMLADLNVLDNNEENDKVNEEKDEGQQEEQNEEEHQLWMQFFNNNINLLI